MDVTFLLLIFLSEIVGTIAGFGSSTILLPFALFLFDFETALVLVAFTHVFGNIGRIGFFKTGLNKSLILKFGIPSIAASLIGAALVPAIPRDSIRLTLGVFLVIYSLFSLFSEEVKVKASTLNLSVGGVLSGFTAGLIGTGGAIRGAFLTAVGLPKDKYIATAAFVALAVDVTRIPVYLKFGFLPNKYVALLPLYFVIAILGSFIGKRIVGRFPKKAFRKVVLIAILLVSLRLIFSS